MAPRLSKATLVYDDINKMESEMLEQFLCKVSKRRCHVLKLEINCDRVCEAPLLLDAIKRQKEAFYKLNGRYPKTLQIPKAHADKVLKEIDYWTRTPAEIQNMKDVSINHVVHYNIHSIYDMRVSVK